MKLKLLSFCCLVLMIILSVSLISPISASETTVKTDPADFSSVYNPNKVLESRFLNMLNKNYVYNDDFKTESAIANNSVLAILNLKDNQSDEYIAERYLSDFVYNMYGVDIKDFSEINPEFNDREGYFYIIPQGYTKFEHEISSIDKNEDGTYTVNSKIFLNSHDGATTVLNAKSLFVKNEKSALGYNIVFSNLT